MQGMATPAKTIRAAAIAAAVLAATPLLAIPIAKDGNAVVPIVLPEEATAAEETASRELAHYLFRSTGAAFRTLRETDSEAAGPAIHVGPTAFARAKGGDPSSLADEEWIVRTAEGRLVLAGGRPRGTLYAVYRFLEDVVGVRWWTPFEETIPGRPDLRTGPLDRRGRPAFGYRDFFGIDGEPVFRARLRLNGDSSGLGPELGGRAAFGMHGVHTYDLLVPPERDFELHPEWFSERAGLRWGTRSQLCATNPDLPAVLGARLLEIARRTRERARERGEVVPTLLDLSPNDWGGRCECAACAEAAAREGSEAGALLSLVNRVAGIVRAEIPEVRLTTLAYTWYLEPPASVRPDPGVIVRVSGYGKRDQAKGALDPANARYRRAVEGWATIAPGMWIWDYGTTFHDRFGLPFANVRHFGEDLRWYRSIGVDGIYVQHDFPIGADMHDLKVWVQAKLLEDPDRSGESLLAEFTRGYYGAASRYVRKYLKLVAEASDAGGGFLPADADPEEFLYFTPEFLAEASALFDRAERSVRRDPVVSRRVRHARLALDWAVLQYGPRPVSRRVVERVRRTWKEQVDLRVPPEERAGALATFEGGISRFLLAPRSSSRYTQGGGISE